MKNYTRKTILKLIMFFSVSITVYSQADYRAKELMNRVFNRIKSYENIEITAGIYYSHIEDDEIKVFNEKMSDFNFFISKRKYKAVALGNINLYNGKEYVYSITPDVKEYTKDRYKFNNSLTLFNLYYENLKGVKYNLLELKEEENKKIQYVSCKLMDEKITIGIDINSLLIVSLEEKTKTREYRYLNEKDTNGEYKKEYFYIIKKTTTKVLSSETNKKISSSFFEFSKDKYPDYEEY